MKNHDARPYLFIGLIYIGGGIKLIQMSETIIHQIYYLYQ
jgi:hypothetical protein